MREKSNRRWIWVGPQKFFSKEEFVTENNCLESFVRRTHFEMLQPDHFYSLSTSTKQCDLVGAKLLLKTDSNRIYWRANAEQYLSRMVQTLILLYDFESKSKRWRGTVARFLVRVEVDFCCSAFRFVGEIRPIFVS